MDKNEQTELKEFASSQVLFVSLLNKYYTAIEKSLTDNSAYSIVTNDYNNVQISTINIENSPKFVVNSEYLNYCIYQNKFYTFLTIFHTFAQNFCIAIVQK